MKIQEVECEKLAKIVTVDYFDNLVLEDTEIIKEKWDSMTDEEKQEWLTTHEETYRVDVDDVFECVLDNVRDWEFGFEEFDEYVADMVITKENKEKLQKVLDEIFSKDVMTVYFRDKKIEND